MLLKDIVRFTYFNIINFFIHPGKIQNKTLLIIKLDVIGDYILFRNFLEELKKDQKYKDYTITLLGNSAYGGLAKELDAQFVDHFIFINFKKMTRNLWYRYKIFKQMAKNGYEVVINPTYSREYNVTDSLVQVLNAKEKIGRIGTLGNIPQWQKSISDRYYTKLIPGQPGILFEFLRNKEFFEALLEKKINLKKPECVIPDKQLKLSSKYIIIFPGAGTLVRKWSTDNFSKLSKYVLDNYDYDIIILGGPNDINDANAIENNLQNSRVKNKAGKTSLIETLSIIKNANLLVSNETSAPHMAVMTNTPVIVIYNGDNFKRFIPYPDFMVENYYPIYHPVIESSFENYEKLSNTHGYISKLDINEIKLEQVIAKLDETIKKGNQ